LPLCSFTFHYLVAHSFLTLSLSSLLQPSESEVVTPPTEVSLQLNGITDPLKDDALDTFEEECGSLSSAECTVLRQETVNPVRRKLVTGLLVDLSLASNGVSAPPNIGEALTLFEESSTQFLADLKAANPDAFGNMTGFEVLTTLSPTTAPSFLPTTGLSTMPSVWVTEGPTSVPTITPPPRSSIAGMMAATLLAITTVIIGIISFIVFGLFVADDADVGAQAENEMDRNLLGFLRGNEPNLI